MSAACCRDQVLVLDATKNMFAAARRILGQSGYIVLTAESEEEAVHLMQRCGHQIAFVVAHIRHKELSLRLKAAAPDVPVMLYGTPEGQAGIPEAPPEHRWLSSLGTFP